MKKAKWSIYPLLLLILAGCIKNDIPYPRIQANFKSFDVEGAYKASQIDSTDLVVTVFLEETTDIRNVKVTEYTVTPDAEVLGVDLSKPIDLSSEIKPILQLYQDYSWIIRAEQPINRYFTVENQIGTSVIDLENRKVTANIPTTSPLESVRVLSIKLWAEGATVSPMIENTVQDFTKALELKVTNHGLSEVWTIEVSQVQAPVTTVAADGWTNVAWVYGEADEKKNNGVEYRKDGETSWTRAPKEWITVNGGSFTARLLHLEPLTKYYVRAYSDENFGEILSFTTGIAIQAPNSNFNSWFLSGKIWNPWTEGGEKWWDTGNTGATTLGTSNSYPTTDTPPGSDSEYCACLESRFVGLSIIGKLAAGNIFAGDYVATDGTNGILSFGRPFTQRPTKLKGYLKYKSVPISHTNSTFTSLKGEPDTCVVWCALSDKDTPFEIRTNPKKLQLFEPSDPTVIAYGLFQSGKSIDDYIQFEVELDYRSTSRVPKYILIVASSSKYGDYFTGGNGSILNIADLELVYDY